MNKPKTGAQNKVSQYSNELGVIQLDPNLVHLRNKATLTFDKDIESRIKQKSQNNAMKSVILIVETAFDFGLNFLLTLQLYQKIQDDLAASNSQSAPLPSLHFISYIESPLSKEQLENKLANFPLLSTLAEQLIRQYPDDSTVLSNEPNIKKITFIKAKVTLTLIHQPPEKALQTLRLPPAELVDFWYLNDSSLDLYDDIRLDALVSQIARLSKHQTRLTMNVKDCSMLNKLKKIGFKFSKETPNNPSAPICLGVFESSPISHKGYQLRPRINKPKHVTIIGGGIASACLAYELTKQGVEVTIYCKDNDIAMGASSNDIGALYPLIHQKRDDISLFYQQALLHARALYDEISNKGGHFEHDWCGLLELSFKHSLDVRQLAIEENDFWPHSLIHSVSAKQASDISGVEQTFGGLFLPQAGWVSPRSLVKALFKLSTETSLLNIKLNTKINSIIKPANFNVKEGNKKNTLHSWELHSDKAIFKADVLVVCAGADSIKLDILNTLPFNATRGQISSMKSNERISQLSTVICHKGYLTPQNNGVHCIGATFQKNDLSTQARQEDDQYNLDILQKCLPNLNSLIDWQPKDISSSKARLRCMTPDHLPMAGAMPDIPGHIKTYPHLAKDKNWKYREQPPVIDNLYILSGFGARGLCTAPLCAKILTADLCNTTYPVDDDMAFNVSPNRFIIRDIIKRKLTV